MAPDRMPEFAARFREILRRHGTDGAFYGHASVGCLHIRPVLNLHDPADVAAMRAIMADVTDLVLAFNGSLSGEHGDGLVRSEWNAQDVRPGGVRGVPAGEAGVRPGERAEPRQGGGRPGDGGRTCGCRPGASRAGPADGPRLRGPGRVLRAASSCATGPASAARRRAGRCARATASPGTSRTPPGAGRTRCRIALASRAESPRGRATEGATRRLAARQPLDRAT